VRHHKCTWLHNKANMPFALDMQEHGEACLGPRMACDACADHLGPGILALQAFDDYMCGLAAMFVRSSMCVTPLVCNYGQAVGTHHAPERREADTPNASRCAVGMGTGQC
jgi:hypothetical protein